MYPANLFNLLPIEIAIGIFRNYFNYDEKVKLLKDDFFWHYLSSPYAWKEKLKIPLKTLKGASENLLHEIESGYYTYRRKTTREILKIINDTKRGRVTVESFVHEAYLSRNSSNQPKIFKEYVPTDRVKFLFNILKSNYHVFKHDIYSDRLGHYTIGIDPRFLENMEYHSLKKVRGYNVLIYKKYKYFVLIVGDLQFCKMNPFSPETLHSNLELLRLISKIAYSDCSKMMVTKNYAACKMKPFRNFYRFKGKVTLDYMSRKNLIKLTTKIK